MAQTRTQLVGGVGISTVDDLTIHGNLNVTGVTTLAPGTTVSFATTALGLQGSPNITVNNLTVEDSVFTLSFSI